MCGPRWMGARTESARLRRVVVLGGRHRLTSLTLAVVDALCVGPGMVGSVTGLSSRTARTRTTPGVPDAVMVNP